MTIPNFPSTPDGRAGRADLAAFGLIGLFAVTLLIIAFRLHPVGDYYTESDFYGGYALGARAIQHGVVDPSRYPVVGPGYEFFLALFGILGTDLFTVGRLLSVAGATGALALWFVTLRRRTGSELALATVALLAATPVFVRYAYSATTDMPATFLATASIAALLGWRHRRAALVAGALAALATLTRYNLAALVPAALVCLFALEPPPAAGRRRAALEYLAGFALLALPWTAYALALRHAPAADLYRNFGFYVNPDATRNVQDEYGFLANARPPGETPLMLLRARPLELLRRCAVNVPLHLWRDAREVLGIPAALACLAGAALAVGRATRRALGAVWAQGALLFLGLVPVFYSDRYSMPLAPVYLTLAGALAASTDGIARRIPAWARAALVAAVLVSLVAWNVPYQRDVLRQAPLETREAGRALAQVARPGENVVSRKGHIGYYSGLTVVPFPRFRTLAELASFARGHDARYLYFSWYEALLRPDFAYLLDTSAAIPGLQVLHVTRDRPSVVYRIGADFGADPAWLSDSVATHVHLARARVQVLPDSLVWTDHLMLAADALGRGDAAVALAHAGVATHVHPQEALGWTIAGEALRSEGRADEARAAYERALALDPADGTARAGLASLHR